LTRILFPEREEVRVVPCLLLDGDFISIWKKAGAKNLTFVN
jgi:hypothetical protein